jgi:hypothetical protein
MVKVVVSLGGQTVKVLGIKFPNVPQAGLIFRVDGESKGARCVMIGLGFKTMRAAHWPTGATASCYELLQGSGRGPGGVDHTRTQL